MITRRDESKELDAERRRERNAVSRMDTSNVLWYLLA
jgi:hypothetical protein